MANETSAAGQASAISKLNTIELPDFNPGKSGGNDLSKYSVKYSKIDLDDPGSRAELEILETRGIRGSDIVILNKDKFVFMDKYFIIVTYLEASNA